MRFCKEFLLADIVSITAIPVIDFIPGDASWQLTPTIPAGRFSPVLTNAVTIGSPSAAAGGAVIPIMRATGKAKDAESNSVAGRLHDVTVTCEADDRDPSLWNYLFAIERTPSHLLLTLRDRTKAFVLATEDTYLCEVERDGAKTSVTFRIQNTMGIQPVLG